MSWVTIIPFRMSNYYESVHTNNLFTTIINRFATGHKYTCDHINQTSVAKMATNKKNAQHTNQKHCLASRKSLLHFNLNEQLSMNQQLCFCC